MDIVTVCLPPIPLTESKESVREKRARKRSSSAVEFSKHEPTQNLDAADAEQDPEIPTSFLSASVREYLELGRSIPGDCHQRRNFYRV